MQVGDNVYLKPSNNAARRTTEIREWKIKSVGRKYFEAWDGERDHSAMKFYIDGFKQVTNYTPDWIVYFSKQEILDENEFYKLFNDIRTVFNGYSKPKLTLEQLRKIKNIIDSE